MIARNMKLKAIFSNQFDEKVEVISIAYSLMGIALCVVSSTAFALWPQHFNIGSPAYWYEILIFLLFGWVPITAANFAFTSNFGLGVGVWSLFKKCCIIYVIGSLTIVIFSYHFYISWVYIGEYIWPMPFHGYACGVFGWVAMTICTWLQFPKEWRSDPNIRKQLFFRVLFFNVSLIFEMTYKIILKLFQLVDGNKQWPLVFLLILIRESNMRSLALLGKKIAGSEDLVFEIIAINYAATRHIIFLSVNMGSLTTTTSSYLILGSDFLINLCHCIAILWYNKDKTELNEKKKVKAVLSLIMNEAVEFTMPIGYIIVMLMAYYGPNAEIIGNIRNGEWQYSAIESLDVTVFWISMMFLVDFASALICSLILQIFCKMNIWKMYLHTLKQVGYLLAIQQGCLLSEVSLGHSRYTRRINVNLFNKVSFDILS